MEREIDRKLVEIQYADLFKGLGRFSRPYKIRLEENSVPKVKPARRVSHTILGRLKEKLDELEKNQIIEKADTSEWVHQVVVVVKKNGKDLRICIDPSGLNDCIADESFLIPTLTTRLEGVKYFSVLDLKDGFWHVVLDDESQKLCTFATPFGNFKFLRMPFGIKSGPKVFQKMNHENFGDIMNVFAYMDDLLITGKTREEHDRALIAVLKRARKKGVKFNKSKMKIAVTEVSYLGHVFSENKIAPDPDRIKAVIDMGKPKTKKDLQKFLGVINYIRSLTAPLREMLKKNIRMF